MKGKPRNIDDYIAEFPENVQKILKEVRLRINKAAPDAEETISYGMPAFKYYGMLVYFAAYEKHIGFYATPSGHSKFEKELSKYKQGKGSVQFPLNAPIPLDLITEMVKFRVFENRTKALLKTKR